MEGAARKIEALIAAGEGLTYDNFADLEPQKRWAIAYSPAWVSWSSRVSGAIKATFGEGSAPMQMILNALRIELLGNGPDKFDQAKAFLMGALEAAREILRDDTFGEIASSSAQGPLSASNRVFIVHGHDDAAKAELEILLREFGLEPIVLHRQADIGKTLIEKFEHYADVGFAFILLTPDEVAFLASEAGLVDDERKKEYRARPNVIFEFGFFVGRLGRERTCCLYKSPVSLPTDLNGVIYKPFTRSIEEAAYSIQKELKAAGYKIA